MFMHSITEKIQYVYKCIIEGVIEYLTDDEKQTLLSSKMNPDEWVSVLKTLTIHMICIIKTIESILIRTYGITDDEIETAMNELSNEIDKDQTSLIDVRYTYFKYSDALKDNMQKSKSDSLK